MASLDRFTRNLDWNLLKYFAQIAQSGSIGAGADALNISQPSVSAALRRLEDHLGTQLCLRTRKGIQLTAAGQMLLSECEQIVARVSAAPAALRAITGSVGGSVLLQNISYIFSQALDDSLASFKTLYPSVELVLEAAPWEDIIQALLRGEISVAVGFDEDHHADLCHALLTRERLQLYCGPGHKLFGCTVTDPSSLAEESFIAISDGEPPTWKKFRERYGLGRRIGGLADNVYDASWLIGLNIGIGNLPEPMATAIAPKLWPLLPVDLLPSLDIHLMWRPDIADRASRLLVDTILQSIGSPVAPVA